MQDVQRPSSPHIYAAFHLTSKVCKHMQTYAKKSTTKSQTMQNPTSKVELLEALHMTKEEKEYYLTYHG